MKTNRVLIALAVAALAAPVLESCKKGENDPFLSLRSRKGRVAGEWNVSSLERKTTTTDKPYNGGTTVVESSAVLSGETLTEDVKVSYTSTGGTTTSSSDKNTATYKQAITFDKDGNYTTDINDVRTDVDTVSYFNNANGQWEIYKETTTTTSKQMINGKWNFLSGVGEVKNKEYITISNDETSTETEVSRSYEKLTGVTGSFWPVSSIGTTSTKTKQIDNCSDCFDNWHITQLKNKEILAEVELLWKDTDTDANGFVSTDETTGTQTMTLTQE